MCIATTISAWRLQTQLPALGSGAEEVHATINGLGERARNASRPGEIVVTLKSLYLRDLKHQKTELLHQTSQLVSSNEQEVHVQPNKAIRG